jgi:hypothetical protein
MTGNPSVCQQGVQQNGSCKCAAGLGHPGNVRKYLYTTFDLELTKKNQAPFCEPECDLSLLPREQFAFDGTYDCDTPGRRVFVGETCTARCAVQCPGLPSLYAPQCIDPGIWLLPPSFPQMTCFVPKASGMFPRRLFFRHPTLMSWPAAVESAQQCTFRSESLSGRGQIASVLSVDDYAHVTSAQDGTFTWLGGMRNENDVDSGVFWFSNSGIFTKLYSGTNSTNGSVVSGMFAKFDTHQPDRNGGGMYAESTGKWLFVAKSTQYPAIFMFDTFDKSTMAPLQACGVAGFCKCYIDNAVCSAWMLNLPVIPSNITYLNLNFARLQSLDGNALPAVLRELVLDTNSLLELPVRTKPFPNLRSLTAAVGLYFAYK